MKEMNRFNSELNMMEKVNSNIKSASNYHLIPMMPVEEIDKRIVNYTRIGDERQLKEFLKSIFAYWEKQGITIDAAKGIACSICCQIFTAVEKYYDIASEEIFFHALTEIVREEHYENIKGKLYECAEIACRQVNEMNKMYSEGGVAAKINKVLADHIFDKNLNLSFLGEKIGLNSKYMATVYEEQTGKNLMEEINKKRIGYFKELVKNGLTVKEAAEKCGYCSLVTLNRWFKKLEGTTPGKLKESYHYIQK